MGGNSYFHVRRALTAGPHWNRESAHLTLILTLTLTLDLDLTLGLDLTLTLQGHIGAENPLTMRLRNLVAGQVRWR